MKRAEIFLGVLRIPVDYIMTFTAFILAYIARQQYPNLIPGIQLSTDIEVFMPWQEYLQFSALASFLIVIIFSLNHLYTLKISHGWQSELFKVGMSTAAWILALIAYFFVIRETFFSRLVLGYAFIFAIVLTSCGRLFIRALKNILLKYNIGKRRIIIVGLNSTTHTLLSHFKKDKHYTVIGVVTVGKEKSDIKINKRKLLGSINDLAPLLKRRHIDEVIQTESNLSEAASRNILEDCREHHIKYSFVPDIISFHQQNVEVYPVAGIPIIFLHPTPLDGWGKVVKRSFDIVFSLIGLILLSPLFAIIAIAIKIDSKGTIIYKYLDDGSRVKRVGQGGKLFKFFKFRTMRPNTHNMRYKELAHLNIRKGTPMVKIKNDPRVTRVGKFLRKTSFDEFPQLWNVLKGDMSLVGPRPHLPEEVANYKKNHKFVLAIKPGITGLAQISGRSDLDFDEEVKLDSYYIENWSLWLDIRIIIKTIFVIIGGKGAD